MSEQNLSITETNLSHAWGRMFERVMTPAIRRSTAPQIVSITDFENGLPREDERIRVALDTALRDHGDYSCATTASLIFPFKVWDLRGRPAVGEFSKFYMDKYLPRLKARAPRQNAHGVYFERMIAFQGVKAKDGKILNEPKNQLEHIVQLWLKAANKNRPRRSALQISIFDPVRDHTGSALAGFPCLQQVSLGYDDEDGFIVNAVYPTQFIFERAYGNYLGLCQLGYFLAREMNLKLARFNCIVIHPELGDVAKGTLSGLRDTVREVLAEIEGSPTQSKLALTGAR